ncbi:ribose-phosphate diphosphokinase [Liquorilactobacillus mali]|uniref:Ribose-phosphate pyrophosphokinase n=1 Tax=Liquorilactobacillus mali KCTC 3596 = DSM 20444 TaxID=1046596 RepID=J1F0J7_9LACO|nr:ribose-phosphate pyrophosphokinase [Liquorilactobacillus mali]EJE97501.1 ribose-phosphate pyrophosphokinase [Liquorilactobacillus mali KCTC 3596 = DSM 20444]KRN10000.1 ribose-phosphate pyrophosphokinase [Liquorilactobacillus mali KCTC 3596 = DSM 20444]MDC7953659.1 ribose-phosphate pyrophosphokinase [Liquorilactobacillus mali]MDV7758490.1 ribose-phosphate diphosphokinase [Liquorilactobacillus mali]QFQ73829.1 ribose-phosphate pyrophosphokinase [Liquorilactobacillus mali]
MREKKEKATLKLFALNSNQKLAEKIATELETQLCEASVKHFSDGEIQININESVRGDDVFVIQSISEPVNENFMELMIMVDALRRSSAGTINIVLPYYGYARADRKARPREPITAKLIANFIQLAGADRVITMDLHAGQLQGFFNIPVDHLLAIFVQAEYFRRKGITNDVVIVAPDHNGVKAARNLATLLKAPIAIVDKRDETRAADMTVIGDVSGRRCIVFDDLIDTGGKLSDAAVALKNAGATEVYACATHPILSGRAVEELENSYYKEVVVTDTIDVPEEKQFDKLKVLSVSKTFAKAIDLIFSNQSVDSLFNKKYTI